MAITAFVPSASCLPARTLGSAPAPPAVTPLPSSTTGTAFLRRVLPRRATVAVPGACAGAPRTVATSVLTVERIANKSYQLEEDEDANSCTSAVYLSSDGSMTIGRTDGPSPDNIKAIWSFDSVSGELVMDIERYFEGEGGLEFMVKRILRGHLDNASKNLENLPVFTGAMYPHPTDYAKHSEVGWFAMIVANDDLPSEEYDISAETSNTAAQ